MNSISFFKALLMKEIDEELKGGQKKLDVAEPKGKITAADFAALRAKKDVKKENSQLEEKVDMKELESELKRLKQENPGKKVTYDFITDPKFPKGYVIYIDGKIPNNEGAAPSVPNRKSKAMDYKQLREQEITTVSDIMATSALDASKRLTIPKGSTVQVVKKRLENEPTVTQLKYNGQLVNVNAGPFINQYLFKETSKPEVKEGELKLGVNPAKLQSLNAVKNIIRKAPSDDQETLVSLAKIMYNWPWYWEQSDARNTEAERDRKAAVATKLANALQTEEGKLAAIDIFNAYAPEDYKITSWESMMSYPNFKAVEEKSVDDITLQGLMETLLNEASKDPYDNVKVMKVKESPKPKADIYGEDPNLDVWADKDIPGQGMTETEDHEVSMAHNSLESIIKSAMELKMKLGADERNIPGWIQDHITNAENYIDQAAQGFHELHDGEEDIDELPDGTEELPAGDEEDAQMTLQGMMEDLFEAKKKPSAGLTKKQKSTIAKKAAFGKDIGKKGKGFKKIASKAAKKYGSKEKGQAVAAAAMWKSAAKKAK